MLLGAAILSGAGNAQEVVDVKPSPQQVAWQELEFGAIIHFGTNTYLTASGVTGRPIRKYLIQPISTLNSGCARFALAARSMSCSWQSTMMGFVCGRPAQTDYGVKSSQWENGKGDVVGRVSAAARKFGLKFGVYLSPWDRHEPRYANSAEYDKYYAAELDELAQNYGELDGVLA